MVNERSTSGQSVVNRWSIGGQTSGQSSGQSRLVAVDEARGSSAAGASQPWTAASVLTAPCAVSVLMHRIERARQADKSAHAAPLELPAQRIVTTITDDMAYVIC